MHLPMILVSLLCYILSSTVIVHAWGNTSSNALQIVARAQLRALAVRTPILDNYNTEDNSARSGYQDNHNDITQEKLDRHSLYRIGYRHTDTNMNTPQMGDILKSPHSTYKLIERIPTTSSTIQNMKMVPFRKFVHKDQLLPSYAEIDVPATRRPPGLKLQPALYSPHTVDVTNIVAYVAIQAHHSVVVLTDTIVSLDNYKKGTDSIQLSYQRRIASQFVSPAIAVPTYFSALSWLTVSVPFLPVFSSQHENAKTDVFEADKDSATYSQHDTWKHFGDYYDSRSSQHTLFDYDIGSQIGRGGQGEVWRAVRLDTEQGKTHTMQNSETKHNKFASFDSDDSEYETHFVLKRLFSGRLHSAWYSGIREIYFGELFRDQPFIARYVEYFIVPKDTSKVPTSALDADLWLVFVDEGPNLRQLLYNQAPDKKHSESYANDPHVKKNADHEKRCTKDVQQDTLKSCIDRKDASDLHSHYALAAYSAVSSNNALPLNQINALVSTLWEIEPRNVMHSSRLLAQSERLIGAGLLCSSHRICTDQQYLGGPDKKFSSSTYDGMQRPSMFWRKMRTDSDGKYVFKQLFHQLISAIASCHNLNVTHRDIKPSNIMLHLSSNPPHLRLGDFGSAMYNEMPMNDELYQSNPSQREETLAYAPPEVLLSDSQPFDPKIPPSYDIWSAGVTLVEFLLALPPDEIFQPDTRYAAKIRLSMRKMPRKLMYKALFAAGFESLCIIPCQMFAPTTHAACDNSSRKEYGMYSHYYEQTGEGNLEYPGNETSKKSKTSKRQGIKCNCNDQLGSFTQAIRLLDCRLRQERGVESSDYHSSDLSSCTQHPISVLGSSGEALLFEMLRWDSQERITAGDALQHEYFEA